MYSSIARCKKSTRPSKKSAAHRGQRIDRIYKTCMWRGGQGRRTAEVEQSLPGAAPAMAAPPKTGGGEQLESIGSWALRHGGVLSGLLEVEVVAAGRPATGGAGGEWGGG